MTKRILVDAKYSEEIRAVLIKDGGVIESFEYGPSVQKHIKGNVYLAKVVRVEPCLQAAFIDYGAKDKSGFLPFDDISPVYYNIPVEDRKDLQQKQQGNIPEIQIQKITNEDKDEFKHYVNQMQDDEDDIDISKYDSNAFEDYSYDKDADAADLNILYKNYKIHEVIKPGQIILVQAQKEERGNKCASFTSFISLAGRYCILMPNKGNSGGVSRKIFKADERKRLKSIASNITATSGGNNFSLVIRTAGANRSAYEIKKDYNYLAQLWNKVREKTLEAQAPAFIHMEDGILHRIIRDMFDYTVHEMIVEGDNAYNLSKKITSSLVPYGVKKIKKHKHKTPIFANYKVEEYLMNLYKPQVKLPSGGYIIINPTEALTAIDVNSGKYNAGRTMEQTALKINMEASREIARQMRIRDISGLIVIDFIDMSEVNNRRILERCFKDFTSRDNARIQSYAISPLGLMEVSRQRVKPSFLEINSTMCNYCQGKGVVRSDKSNSLLMLRTLECEIANNAKSKLISIVAHPDSIEFFHNFRRKDISALETKYAVKINLLSEQSLTPESFYIEKNNFVKLNGDVSDSRTPIISSRYDLRDEGEAT